MNTSTALPFAHAPLPPMGAGDQAALNGFAACTASSGSVYNNGRPIASVSMQLYSCMDCSYKTPSLRKLGRHKSVNHAGVKYRCEMCDFVTGYQSNYYRHKKQVHSVGSPNGGQSVLDCSPRKSALKKNSYPQSGSTAAPHHSTINNAYKSIPLPNSCHSFQPATNPSSLLGESLTSASLSADLNAAWLSMHPDARRALDWLFGYRTPPIKFNCPKCHSECRTQIECAQHALHCLTDHNKSFDRDSNVQNFDKKLSACISNAKSENGFVSTINNASTTTAARDAAKTSSLPSTIAVAPLPPPKKRPYRCSYFNCDYSADKSRDYLHHLKDEHRLHFDIFYCDRCYYAARNAHKLARHYDIVHADRVGTNLLWRARGCSRKIAIDRESSPPAKSSRNRDDRRRAVLEDDVIYGGADEIDKISDNEIVRSDKNIIDTLNGITDTVLDDGQTANGRSYSEEVTPCRLGEEELEAAGYYRNSPHTTERLVIDDDPRIDNDGSDTKHNKALMMNHSCGTDSLSDVFIPDSDDVCSALYEDDVIDTTYDDVSNFADGDGVNLEGGANSALAYDGDADFDDIKLQEADNSAKTCITETDAIELPSEQFTSDEMNDPDVKNRFCKICGYTGKWMSEMIRHKRVHTNQRPFKCKYCDRTSKWKADLIRHVSKVHGMRVISKYSRANVLDSETEPATMVKKPSLAYTSSADHNDGSNSDSGRGSVNDTTLPIALYDVERKSVAENVKHRASESPAIQSNGCLNGVGESSIYCGEMTDEAGGLPPSTGASIDDGLRAFLSSIANGFNVNDASANVNFAALLYQQRLTDFLSAAASLWPNSNANGNRKGSDAPSLSTSPLWPPLPPPPPPISLAAKNDEGEDDDFRPSRRQIMMTSSKAQKPTPVELRKFDDSVASSSLCARVTSSSSQKRQKLSDRHLQTATFFRRQTPSESTMASAAWTSDVEKYVEAWRSADGATTFRCKACRYDTRDLHTFRAHVQKHENRKPYQCSTCGYRSNWSSDVHKHIRLKKSGHENANVIRLSEFAVDGQRSTSPLGKLKFSSRNQMPMDVSDSSVSSPNRMTPPFSSKRHSSDHNSSNNAAKRHRSGGEYSHELNVDNADGLETFKSTHNFTDDQSDASSRRTDETEPSSNSNSLINSKILEEPMGQSPNQSEARELPCQICPFRCSLENRSDYDSHVKSHARPKGIMYYKCLYCSWYSKKKLLVFEHLRWHVAEPNDDHMLEIERTLITTPSKDGAELCQKSTDSRDIGNQPAKGVDSADLSTSSGGALDLSVNKMARSNLKSPISFSTKHQLNGSGQTPAGNTKFEQSERECDIPVIDNKHSPQGSTTITAIEDNALLDIDDSIDPEAYIHAGEVALGSEKFVFADLLPKDIQKVSALVDGQLRKMWQCRYCTHVSKRRANIRMHEKKHFKPNAIGLLKCPQCNYRGDKRSLKVHYRSHAINVQDVSDHQRLLCAFCPATFRQKAVHDAHQAFHNGHHRYRCSLCSYAVPSQHQLTQHAHVHRQTPDDDDVDKVELEDDATDVEKDCEQPLTISEITSSSSNDAYMQCKEHNWPKCKLSPLKIKLKKEKLPKMDAIKPKKLQCRFCPAKFAERSQILRHEQFHGVSLKHKCHLCDYSVPFPINLIKHLRAHHDLNVNSVAALTPSIVTNATAVVKTDPDYESESLM